MRKLRSLAVVTAAVALTTIGSTTAASAAPVSRSPLEAIVDNESLPVQTRIDAQLKLAPGGTQVGPNEVSWNNGSLMISFPDAGAVAAPPMSAPALKTAGMLPAGTAAQKSASVEAVAAASIGGCPTVTFGNDWYCFYADANYGGRRLQWSDSYPVSGGGIAFQDYGFQYQMSSWVNGGGKYIDVYYLSGPYVQPLNLLTEPPHTSSSSMAPNQNDRASGFYTRG